MKKAASRSEALTAKASGLTPFSISDTESESCVRVRPVFYHDSRYLAWYICEFEFTCFFELVVERFHTRSTEISSSTSTTSLAARRFSFCWSGIEEGFWVGIAVRNGEILQLPAVALL